MTDFKAEDNTGTIPVQDRHQIDVAALTAFMRDSVVGFEGPLGLEEFAGGPQENCLNQRMQWIENIKSSQHWRMQTCQRRKPMRCAPMNL